MDAFSKIFNTTSVPPTLASSPPSLNQNLSPSKQRLNINRFKIDPKSLFLNFLMQKKIIEIQLIMTNHQCLRHLKQLLIQLHRLAIVNHAIVPNQCVLNCNFLFF